MLQVCTRVTHFALVLQKSCTPFSANQNWVIFSCILLHKEKHWKLNTRVCLFIIPSEYILSLIWFFLIPPKNPYSNQATQAKFSYPKKSRNRKFQTQQNPSIIPVTWNPEYPPGATSKSFFIYFHISFPLCLDIRWNKTLHFSFDYK